MDSRHKPARRTTTTYGRAAAELPTPISLLDGEDANPPDEQTLILPILPVRDTVILPNMVVPLFIEQPGALSAIRASATCTPSAHSAPSSACCACPMAPTM